MASTLSEQENGGKGDLESGADEREETVKKRLLMFVDELHLSAVSRQVG